MARPVLPITALRGGAPPPPPSSSSPVDQWTKRLQEAQRLVDEVAERVAERESVPPSLPRELQRRTAEIRRKVAIVGTRLDMLKEDLSDLPKRQNMLVVYKISLLF
jgi:SYP5 family syntaxin